MGWFVFTENFYVDSWESGPGRFRSIVRLRRCDLCVEDREAWAGKSEDEPWTAAYRRRER